MRTGIGAKGEDSRIFVLDLTGEKLKSVDPKTIRGIVIAEKAKVQNIVTQPNPAIGGWRLSFELGVKEQPRRLLQSISGLQLRELPGSEVCCGFGGTFCVKYPEISDKMVGDKSVRVAS